jgi:subtilisin family serine protease
MMARGRGRGRLGRIGSLLALGLLSACGGGGGASPSSTPTPTPSPPVTPTPVNYDTAEYRASTGPNFHSAITAYQAGASGAGVTVGVIDSGISDPTGELTGRISAASRDFAGHNSIADVDGHGTEVSMIVAAARNDRAILGVAWGSTLLALRTDTTAGCTGSDSFCFSTTAIANALDHAVANGARVVNISLGGNSATNTLRQAVNRATAAGTIIVISAGNDGTAVPDPLAQSLADPSISRGLVLIAAAVDQNGAHASFSNGAQGFENSTISALGVGVVTLNQNGALVSGSGTSFSAPLVSGAIALLAQAFPNLSSAQIVQLLLTSATDAGAAGADATFGVGILDLAKAFAPQGSLSLAGSTTPVSLSASTSLSTPMGDAALSAQSVSGIVTDRLGRAYGLDLSAGLQTATPGLRLASSLRAGTRNLSLGVRNARIALSLAPDRAAGPLTLNQEQAQGARLLAARIAARIAPGTDIAVGLATGAAPLGAMLDEAGRPPFLVARDDATLTADFRANSAVRLQHALGGGLGLFVTAEQGRIERDRRPGSGVTGARMDDPRYEAAGFGLVWGRGPLDLSASASRIAESGTALGARFAPILGAQSATTTVASLSARLVPGGGWTLAGEWRRGWTRAAPGGTLREGGRLTSEAWGVEARRARLLHPQDSLSLGFTRPLRVIASNFPLTLPVAYDYASGTATEGVQRLDLVPRGREQVLELAYARPLGAGWLTANLYRREEAGNIAISPDDIGGAIRFELSF